MRPAVPLPAQMQPSSPPARACSNHARASLLMRPAVVWLGRNGRAQYGSRACMSVGIWAVEEVHL